MQAPSFTEGESQAQGTCVLRGTSTGLSSIAHQNSLSVECSFFPVLLACYLVPTSQLHLPRPCLWLCFQENAHFFGDTGNGRRLH